MGLWTQINPGRWRYTADANPGCVIATERFSASSAYKLGFNSCEDGTKLVCFSDWLGRSAFAVGFDDAGTGGDAVVLRRELGGTPTSVENQPHGLTEDIPGYFEVRFEGGRNIQLRLNGSATPIL